jgi:hypothetical protein
MFLNSCNVLMLKINFKNKKIFLQWISKQKILWIATATTLSNRRDHAFPSLPKKLNGVGVLL